MNKSKKVKRKADVEGVVHIAATFNNTIITVTDRKGDVFCWNSPGKYGFKGSKQSTPFAAQMAAKEAGKFAYDAGMRKIDIVIKGAGNGRESAIRAFASSGMEIRSIKDKTPIPHNGCRPPKRRRI